MKYFGTGLVYTTNAITLDRFLEHRYRDIYTTTREYIDNARSLVFWYETLLSAFEMFKSSIRPVKEYALCYMIACIALTFAIATLYEIIVFVFDRRVVAAVGVAGPGGCYTHRQRCCRVGVVLTRSTGNITAIQKNLDGVELKRVVGRLLPRLSHFGRQLCLTVPPPSHLHGRLHQHQRTCYRQSAHLD